MSGSVLPFTITQLQQAASEYISRGLAPSWWGSRIQALNTTGSAGSAVTPSIQTQMGQQAITTASAAQQSWLAGLPTNPTPPTGGSEWTLATNSDGRQVYVNTGATGGPPQTSTPSLGEVSQYLQGLLNAGSDPVVRTPAEAAAEAATEAAGSAAANWMAGLGDFRLGSGSLGSYGVGSVIPRDSVRPYDSAGSSGSGRAFTYFGGSSVNNTSTSVNIARNIRESDDLANITYSASINDEPKAAGPITTLLDLTNRDQQENDIFPIRTETTWFTRDQERRLLPFAPVIQETALRGPGAFGQRFSFDLGSIMVGDLLLGTALQIQLDHWLDPQTQRVYAAGKIRYQDPTTAWEYANSLGTSIIQLAELEVDGKTLETIDGDFIQTFSALFAEYNSQIGIAYDHLGQVSIRRLTEPGRVPNLFPVENGNLNCILPFFFMRTRLRESLPMIAVREGYVKIHITLRPFDQCVRQMRGFRDTCTSVPPPTPVGFTFDTCTWTYNSSTQRGAWDIPPQSSFTYILNSLIYDWNYSVESQRGSWINVAPFSFSMSSVYRWTAGTWAPSPPRISFTITDPNPLDIPSLRFKYYYWDGPSGQWTLGFNTGIVDVPPTFDFIYGDSEWKSVVGDWSVAAPPFKSVQLLTYGAIVDGSYRSKMLHNPFEIMHRQVQTFYFDEPLKYSIGKRQDAIRIQLPLEANHPIEEIIWFIRRKGTSANNEWTNFTGVVESEWSARAAERPMLSNAIIQVNGTVLCDADEQFYREGIASAHRGGFAAYSRFIYGYSFAKTPGEHQPSGSMNASRLNSLRLVLDVMPPGGDLDSLWEVKVFCIGMNWLRFENGLANPMFDD